MKKLFLSMVALVMATMSYAQSKLVATLTHGEEITMYTGASAFESAYNAAKSGDVITLSGGSFYGVTISKAVTIRGAGIDATVPTQISSLEINIPESDTCRFSIEGVSITNACYFYGSCSEPYFIKCQFFGVNFYDRDSWEDFWDGYYLSSSIKDATFVNCWIEKNLSIGGTTTAKFSHCFVYNYDNLPQYSSKAQFMNCVLRGTPLSWFKRSTFINSILEGRYDNVTENNRLPTETIAMNCVAYTRFEQYGKIEYYNEGNFFPYLDMQGSQIDCTVSTTEELFKNTVTYDLNDEAKAKFLGTDGTEIGLYGGKYPYNSTPAYPRITKLNVAKQSTADDKLSVDIEVSAAE